MALQHKSTSISNSKGSKTDSQLTLGPFFLRPGFFLDHVLYGRYKRKRNDHVLYTSPTRPRTFTPTSTKFLFWHIGVFTHIALAILNPNYSSSNSFHLQTSASFTMLGGFSSKNGPASFSIPSPSLFPVTIKDWKHALVEVKRLYFLKQYKQCAAHCMNLLANSKGPVCSFQ